MRSNVVMISRLPGHPHVKYVRARVSVCGFVRVTQNRNCSAHAGGGRGLTVVSAEVYNIIVQSTAVAVVVQ